MNNSSEDDEIEYARGGKKQQTNRKDDDTTISIEDSYEENESKDCLNGTDSISREADDEIESDEDDGDRNGQRDDSNDDVHVIEDDEDEDDEEEEEEEDANKPSGAECLSRCKQFAEITGTDNALAMFYLQDTKWELERALNAFYQHTQPSLSTKKNPTNNQSQSANSKKIVACFDIDRLNRDEKRCSRKQQQQQEQEQDNQDEATTSTVVAGKNSPPKKNKLDDSAEQVVVADDKKDATKQDKSNYFKILSWNIDGLDKSNLESRALGVATKILSEKPDIVLLQEVVVANEKILRNKLSDMYEFSSGNTVYYNSSSSSSAAAASAVFDEQSIANDLKSRFGANVNMNDFYYTSILTRKTTCTIKSRSVKQFANSVMNRNLLEVKLMYKNRVHVSAMTAHLESTQEFSKQRVEQLKYCLKYMLEQNENYLVFFGGDLNLRDSELKAIGGLPKGVYDLWESTGSRKECLYTWDCLRNSNLKMNAKFKPRCRFDRLYFRQPTHSQQVTEKPNAKSEPVNHSTTDAKLTLTPVYFELEGLEKLKSCGRFCSDHWAIQSYCQLQIDNSV